LNTLVYEGDYVNLRTFNTVDAAAQFFPLEYVVVDEDDSRMIAELIILDSKNVGSVFSPNIDVVPKTPKCQMKCNLITSYINSNKEPI